jgi:outer membrane receptor protein involved in Fe transport
LHTTGIYKALLLAGCASTFALATPAMAQDDAVDCTATPDDPSCADADTTIFVTGSRIGQRGDFTSNSPTVTVDEAILDNSSTSALESNLNKLPQFVPAQTPTAGGDIQPTATNTPGAATVSLRGVGANRNLVLLDGRRATPSNASMVVDISTIPAAAIERVEVISGGASATYGADAVAGVTNFILKKNFQGLELDGRMGITQEGDGFEYQVSGIMGADFADGRGNVSLAMSMNTREKNFQRDRDWYASLLNDPLTGGSAFFNPAPGAILSFANPVSQAALNTLFPGAVPPVNSGAPFNTGGGFNLQFNPDGTAWAGTAFAQRGAAGDFHAGPLNGYPWKKTAAGTIGFNNTNLYLILPLTRYNAFARGNYEINDWIGVFGQALFSSVETYTRNEPGPVTNGWDVFLPYGTGQYVGSQGTQANGQVLGSGNPSSVILNGMPTNGLATGTAYVDPTPQNLADNPTNPRFSSLYGTQFACANVATNPVGGCTNNQVLGQFLPAELQFALNNRANPNLPWQLFTYMPDDRETFSNVVTFSLIAGLEGSVPGTDWTWEAFVNHGESSTFARQTGVYGLERVQSVLSAPAFGRGLNIQGNQESGGFGASTGKCTTGVNFFAPPAGGFSNDCLEAMRADLKNRSHMRQTIVEANVQGGLFDLPAGQLRFALGASYRENDYEFINDTLTTQGRSYLDQALGIYPSGDAFGFIKVKELYGELLIPVLSDIPFIQEFNLEVGGRMSNYSTTGTSYTYKLLGDWKVTDWLRFRGGYNRAERAPNIGELFLAAQQTFGVNNRGDVCSRLNPNSFSANPAVNPSNAANVEAVCRALMNQAGPDAANLYYTGVQSTSGFGFAFPTLVGNPNLVPEKADTFTVGLVVNSPVSSGPLSRLRLSVDGYDITIKDAIGAQTIGAVQQQCFDPLFNPLVSGASGSAAAATAAANTQFCQLLPRNGTGQLGNVLITYANAGRVHLRGIDAQLDWGMDLGPGTVTLNTVANYQIDFESSSLFPQLPLIDYVGTTGAGENGLNANPFKYRALTTLGYGVGPWRLALQWQYYSKLHQGCFATTPACEATATPYPSYNLFNLSGNYQVTEDIGIRLGVDNLFNKAPPRGNFNPNITATTAAANGQLNTQNQFLTGVHDTNGRRFWIGGNIRF